MALDLEHERGKLMGLGQSSAALREHNGILETALAKREADLVQLNLQVWTLLCSRRLAAGRAALRGLRLCGLPLVTTATCRVEARESAGVAAPLPALRRGWVRGACVSPQLSCGGTRLSP